MNPLKKSHVACAGTHESRTRFAFGPPRSRRVRWTALPLLLVMFGLPISSFAQTALSDDADEQTGNTPNLSLTTSSNLYLRFGLSSTLPDGTPGSSVSKATVKLYPDLVKSPGVIDVFLIASNWSEKTVRSSPPGAGADHPGRGARELRR